MRALELPAVGCPMKVWFCDNHPQRKILSVGDARPRSCPDGAFMHRTTISSVDVPHVALAGGPDRWDPKGLRELLCQQEMHAPDPYTLGLIADLIRVLDIHRPLGNDGKHNERHTPTCGCER